MIHNPVRCANIDWLEVYCIEPFMQPRDAQYFRDQHYEVRERDYGTRVYRQMFVICDQYGNPWVEVRRDPASAGEPNSVLQIGSCHLRLTNRACYYDHAATDLREFMNLHGYTYSRISRIDVCLDFSIFDSGDNPAAFLRRYLKGKYRKINQARVHVHGDDTWSGQEYNSISWGSKRSQVSTKLYNKTKELSEVHDKPYIRQSWFAAGLIDHPIDCYKLMTNGEKRYPDIWRLEFSITSSVKGWYTIEEDGNAKKLHSYRNNLDIWDSREKVLQKILSLIPHYFKFKYYRPDISKYECRDKVLFQILPDDKVYHVERVAAASKPLNPINKLRHLLEEYRERKHDHEIQQSIDVILRAIIDDNLVNDMGEPFTRTEILILQRLIANRINGINEDYADVAKQLKEIQDSGGLFA